MMNTMKSRIPLCIALGTGLLLQSLPAQGQLKWRVSIKVVRDANGNRADDADYNGGADLNTDEEIIARIDAANDVMPILQTHQSACDIGRID